MYTEVVVPRKNTGGGKLLKNALLALAVVCLILGMSLMPIAFVGVVVFGLLFWKVEQHVDIEYQYCLLEDDFDIDKVISNSRRKHIATIKTSQIVAVAPKASENLNGYESWAALDVSANDSSRPPYVMVCHINGAKKRVLLQMNDNLLKSLKRQLGSKVFES